VVGAGVAGLLAALNLGGEVDVFEAARPGLRGRRCAGVVSTGTLARLPEAGRFVEQEYVGLELYVPELELRASVTSREPFACKLDRSAHEARLAELVEGRGARVLERVRVRSVRPARGGVEVEWSGGRGTYDAVVIAEGYPPLLSRSLGLAPPVEARVGVHAVARLREGASDTIYVVYSPRLLGGFAWAAPAGGERCSVGVVSRWAAPRLLRVAAKLLERRMGLRLSEPGTPVGGFVLRGYPASIGRGRVFLFGDAAAMVKSLSGGGLYAISALAKPLASIVDAVAAGSAPDPRSLLEVERVVRTLRRGFALARRLDGALAHLPRAGVRLEASVRRLEYDDHLEALLQILLSSRPRAAR